MHPMPPNLLASRIALMRIRSEAREAILQHTVHESLDCVPGLQYNPLCSGTAWQARYGDPGRTFTKRTHQVTTWNATSKARRRAVINKL